MIVVGKLTTALDTMPGPNLGGRHVRVLQRTALQVPLAEFRGAVRVIHGVCGVCEAKEWAERSSI